MMDPADDPDLKSPDPELFEAALQRLLASRADVDELEEADKLESGPDLQDEFRKSGARQIDELSYATNQGTVILASPADVKRLELSNRLQGSIDRTRKWGEPGFLGSGQHALRGRGK